MEPSFGGDKVVERYGPPKRAIGVLFLEVAGCNAMPDGDTEDKSNGRPAGYGKNGVQAGGSSVLMMVLAASTR